MTTVDFWSVWSPGASSEFHAGASVGVFFASSELRPQPLCQDLLRAHIALESSATLPHLLVFSLAELSFCQHAPSSSMPGLGNHGQQDGSTTESWRRNTTQMWGVHLTGGTEEASQRKWHWILKVGDVKIKTVGAPFRPCYSPTAFIWFSLKTALAPNFYSPVGACLYQILQLAFWVLDSLPPSLSPSLLSRLAPTHSQPPQVNQHSERKGCQPKSAWLTFTFLG